MLAARIYNLQLSMAQANNIGLLYITMYSNNIIANIIICLIRHYIMYRITPSFILSDTIMRIMCLNIVYPHVYQKS